MSVVPLDKSNHDVLDAIREAVSTVFMGRKEAIELALTCLLSDGHLLIEDVPGSGKTSLSSALARALALISIVCNVPMISCQQILQACLSLIGKQVISPLKKGLFLHKSCLLMS